MNITVFLSLVAATISATGPTLNTERIDQLTDLKGKLNEKEGAYKISFPRDDIAVAVDGWKIPAFMGLTYLGLLHQGHPQRSNGHGRYRSIRGRS